MSASRLTPIFSLALLLSTTACELVDTGIHPDPALDSHEAVIEGSSPASCPAIPTKLETEDKYLKASFQQSACAKLQVCIDSAAWDALTPSTFIPSLDIVILFDTTGSMSPYIQAMIQNNQQLIVNLEELTPNLRLGLASFRDYGDRSGTKSDKPFMLHVPLTTKTEDVSNALATLNASGGGDIQESLATAIKAALDGKAHEPYFGASEMGWGTDSGRVKIVLGITDAMNRVSKLPAGAPTLDQAAELMKQEGVLFLGIGRKGSTSTSFADLTKLAMATGAIVRAPGVDLDGDGLTSTPGELNAGDPAVLLMNGSGHLEGSGTGANPTRVLADAITAMVKQVRPFQFDLNLLAGAHAFAPATNQLAISAGISGQRCFTRTVIDALPAAGCPSASFVRASVFENSSGTTIDPAHLKAVLEVDLTCGANPFPVPVPSEPPACLGPGCNGGVIGI